MDQPVIETLPKGKFYTFENNRKRARGPQFQGGEIALPDGSASFDLQGTFAKAEHMNGKPVITRMWGRTNAAPIGANIHERTAAEAARATEKPRAAFIGKGNKPYMLEPGQYVFFRNMDAGKTGKTGNAMTDMYGYWNPGGDHPITKLGGWFGESEKGIGYFNGETQLPMPGKAEHVDLETGEILDENAMYGEPSRAGRSLDDRDMDR